MLPSFAMSSYRQYKSDTNSIANWLVKTAKCHGFDGTGLCSNISSSINSTKPQKLRGRERTLARRAAQADHSTQNTSQQIWHRHTLAVRDFLILATFIAQQQNPPIEVSPGFIATLNRAIALRTEVGQDTYGEIRHNQENDDTISSHGYFVNVLKEVRIILRPCLPHTKPDAPTSIKKPAKLNDTSDRITNMFRGLDVEELSDVSTVVPGVNNFKTLTNKPGGSTEFEVDINNDFSEACTALSCLLRDLNQIRSSIKSQWQKYKNSECDLVSAALTTNVALDMARGLEEEQQEIFARHGSFEQFYRKYYQHRYQAVGEQTHGDQLELDVFNVKVYKMASNFYLPVYFVLQGVLHSHVPSLALLSQLAPLPPQEMHEDPSKMSSYALLCLDVTLLSTFLPDAFLYTTRRDAEPHEDEIIRAISHANTTGTITLSTLFAIQVYLDIRHVLRQDVSKGYDDMQTMLFKMLESSEKFVEEQYKLWSPVPVPAEATRMMQNLIEWMRHVGSEEFMDGDDDGFPTAFSLHVKRHKLRLWNTMPLTCGMVAYELKVRFYEIGLRFANSMEVVVMTVHLYNAVRQEQLLSTPWLDMECLLNIQPPTHLLAVDRPSSIDQYHKRLCLTLGMSLRSFARGRRAGNARNSTNGPRALQRLAPVTLALSCYYSGTKNQIGMTSDHLQKIVSLNKQIQSGELLEQAMATAEDGVNAQKGFQTPKKRISQVQLNLSQLICVLGECIRAEAPEISFDYLIMYRQCWDMLEKVRIACEPLMQIARDTLGGPAPRMDIPLLGVVEDIFGSLMAEYVGRQECKCRAKHCQQSTMMSWDILTVAADAMAEVLRPTSSSDRVLTASNCLKFPEPLKTPININMDLEGWKKQFQKDLAAERKSKAPQPKNGSKSAKPKSQTNSTLHKKDAQVMVQMVIMGPMGPISPIGPMFRADPFLNVV